MFIYIITLLKISGTTVKGVKGVKGAPLTPLTARCSVENVFLVANYLAKPFATPVLFLVMPLACGYASIDQTHRNM